MMDPDYAREAVTALIHSESQSRLHLDRILNAFNQLDHGQRLLLNEQHPALVDALVRAAAQ